MKGTRKERSLVEDLLAEISGDRRANRRYGVELPLEYSVMRDGRAIANGSGTTIDLSSTGTAFLPHEELEPGMFVQMAIEWPASGEQDCPMELVVAGTVVRRAGQAAAIRNDWREFRTPARPLVMAAGY